MNERTGRLPRSLRGKIRAFGSAVILVFLAVGCLMCGTAVRSMWSYRRAVIQLREIQELKTEISKVSGLLQGFAVSGGSGLSECTAAWERMSDRIYGLRLPASGMVGLLTEDLQTYQRNTEEELYLLAEQADASDYAERYTRIISQQEDRQFLCELLLNHLTSYLSERYPVLVRESVILLALGIAVFIYLLLLTHLFTNDFSRDIYRPVQMLEAQAEEIMAGNYDLEELPVLQEDELGRLTTAFNEMKDRIRENFRDREKMWKLESLLRDAELRALQSQVNPHFLFNVLGLATEAALTENADQTVDILENISYMLHYGLTSVREDAWLKDEVKMVHAYVFLQQRRFGDRVSFSVSVPREVPPLRIPGMTLQPIVENAVKHGVEHMTAGGRVEVTLTQTPEAVELCVRDNGCGISGGRLEALRRGEAVRENSRSTGLGLANVRSRMAMFYGRSDLMRIESVEGRGTSVYIKYLIREEAPDVSDPDRGR